MRAKWNLVRKPTMGESVPKQDHGIATDDAVDEHVSMRCRDRAGSELEIERPLCVIRAAEV